MSKFIFKHSFNSKSQLFENEVNLDDCFDSFGLFLISSIVHGLEIGYRLFCRILSIPYVFDQLAKIKFDLNKIVSLKFSNSILENGQSFDNQILEENNKSDLNLRTCSSLTIPHWILDISMKVMRLVFFYIFHFILYQKYSYLIG